MDDPDSYYNQIIKVRAFGEVREMQAHYNEDQDIFIIPGFACRIGWGGKIWGCNGFIYAACNNADADGVYTLKNLTAVHLNKTACIIGFWKEECAANASQHNTYGAAGRVNGVKL